MKEHVLKVWPEYYQSVVDGIKPFEFRRDDRDYKVGDTLRLREWNPDYIDGYTEAQMEAAYTGRETVRIVTYKLPGGAFGLPKGLCILGLAAPAAPNNPLRKYVQHLSTCRNWSEIGVCTCGLKSLVQP